MISSIIPNKLIFEENIYRTNNPEELISIIRNIKKGQKVKKNDLSRRVPLNFFISNNVIEQFVRINEMYLNVITDTNVKKILEL